MEFADRLEVTSLPARAHGFGMIEEVSIEA